METFPRIFQSVLEKLGHQDIQVDALVTFLFFTNSFSVRDLIFLSQ